MAKRRSRPAEEPRTVTRKEHRQRAADRRRNRRLYLGTGIALGLALLVVVYGLVNEFVIRPNSTIATVGETRIITKNFWKRTFFEQNRLQNQLMQLAQMEQQFGNQGFFTSQINQIQATLSSPFTLGVNVLDQMIQEEVVRQQAAARGITVSDAEIDAALRKEIASSENTVVEADATATAEAGVAATATATAWTPTPTPTIDVSSTVTVTATPVSTPLPPTPLPIITDAQYNQGVTQLTENLQKVAKMSLDDYRAIIAARLLSDKLSTQIGDEQVSPTEEEVHARHILLNIITPEPTPEPVGEGTPTPEPTLTPTPLPEGFPTPTPTPARVTTPPRSHWPNELRQRILDGEDFATLAEEYSDDPGSASQRRRPRLVWQGHNGRPLRECRVQPDSRRDQRTDQNRLRLSHHRSAGERPGASQRPVYAGPRARPGLSDLAASSDRSHAYRTA